MGLVVSSFGLVIVLARAEIIAYSAMGLTIAGNIIVYLTLLGFFMTFDQDDADYSMW